MEKNIQTPEQVESVDIIAKARENKKSIMMGLIAAAIVIVGAVAWLLIAQSGSRNADELIARADAAQTDSIATVLYKEAANAGYKSGNRAKAQLGISLYQKGEYAEALKYLEDCSLDDKIAAAGVYVLTGDCYVNLEQYDKALKAFAKGVSVADHNPEIVPFILIKKANVYRAQQKYADEAECYKTIIDEYPSYVQNLRTDIKKYYERANAQAK